jgi:hypothetical protein
MDIHTYNYDSARLEDRGQTGRGGATADAGLQLFSKVQPDSDTSSSKNVLDLRPGPWPRRPWAWVRPWTLYRPLSVLDGHRVVRCPVAGTGLSSAPSNHWLLVGMKMVWEFFNFPEAVFDFFDRIQR